MRGAFRSPALRPNWWFSGWIWISLCRCGDEHRAARRAERREGASSAWRRQKKVQLALFSLILCFRRSAVWILLPKFGLSCRFLQINPPFFPQCCFSLSFEIRGLSQARAAGVINTRLMKRGWAVGHSWQVIRWAHRWERRCVFGCIPSCPVRRSIAACREPPGAAWSNADGWRGRCPSSLCFFRANVTS